MQRRRLKRQIKFHQRSNRNYNRRPKRLKKRKLKKSQQRLKLSLNDFHLQSDKKLQESNKKTAHRLLNFHQQRNLKDPKHQQRRKKSNQPKDQLAQKAQCQSEEDQVPSDLTFQKQSPLQTPQSNLSKQSKKIH